MRPDHELSCPSDWMSPMAKLYIPAEHQPGLRPNRPAARASCVGFDGEVLSMPVKVPELEARARRGSSHTS
jgi:hypothetical protein